MGGGEFVANDEETEVAGRFGWDGEFVMMRSKLRRLGGLWMRTMENATA